MNKLLFIFLISPLNLYAIEAKKNIVIEDKPKIEIKKDGNKPVSIYDKLKLKDGEMITSKNSDGNDNYAEFQKINEEMNTQSNDTIPETNK